MIISSDKFASLALIGEAQYPNVSLKTADMGKHFITSLTILLSTCPAFGVEQLELLKPSASSKCTRCDRPDMVADQLVVKLGVGWPFMIKAPTLESLLGYTELFCGFRFR